MRNCLICSFFFIANTLAAQNIIALGEKQGTATSLSTQATDSTVWSVSTQIPGNGKKPHRFGFAFGGSRQPVPEYADFPDYELKETTGLGLIKIYYENFTKSTSGMGASVNLVGGFEKHYRNSPDEIAQIYYGTKIYTSAYAFRDFDIENAFTLGLSGGPAVVLNIVNADPDQNDYQGSATSTGFGLHFGQYILKYLSVNKKDQKSFFLRMGFDQYVSINSGFTGLFYVALGF